MRASSATLAPTTCDHPCKAAPDARRIDRTGPCMKRMIIGITGASGIIYGVRALEILRELPRGDGNTTIVSHGGNIARATGLRLAEGEIGVVRIGADGRIETVGQLLGSDLGAHARVALAARP